MGTNIQKEEMNKNTVINFVSSIWNEKDLSQLDQFFSQEFKRRVNNVEIASNKEELTANIQVYLTGFPDLNLLIDDILPYHDQVIMNWTITGTNTGVFGEFPATGKKIKVSGLSHLSFD
jgi:predicted ester cyclase